MLLLIDNYDSFVYNLSRYFRELFEDTRVVRNDEITIEEIEQLNPQAIVLSPGPCGPKEAGISLNLVNSFKKNIPILGVCLGHQTIAQACGATVRRSGTPMHGKSSTIKHDGTGLFKGLDNPLQVGRYHSLSIDIPEHSDLQVHATSEDDEIMAFSHKEWPLWGVQFHPESVLTPSGHDILRNFLKLAGIEDKSNDSVV
jgi:anthranilate synthase component 2/para-aminobenzoate synthetase component 2